MGDYIVLAILIVVIAAIIIYLYRAKKNGQACIGCPASKQCAENKKTSCCSNCSACGMNCPSKQEK